MHKRGGDRLQFLGDYASAFLAQFHEANPAHLEHFAAVNRFNVSFKPGVRPLGKGACDVDIASALIVAIRRYAYTAICKAVTKSTRAG